MQLRELREYCERRGWQIAGEYVDVGISGAKDKRPQLDRMMADAHKRRFDVVAVWKFDRFARSVSHLLRALDTFRVLGIEFVSLSESLCTPEQLWRAYVQLTEAEAAFRVHKSDLQIRPVWHHREHRVGAHILVCFLACVLWKTLAASCQQAGLGDEPRQVFEELSEITLVDVALPTRSGVELRKRCISQPTEHQRILLQRLGMRLPTALDRLYSRNCGSWVSPGLAQG
jgi:hypothetical protein